MVELIEFILRTNSCINNWLLFSTKQIIQWAFEKHKRNSNYEVIVREFWTAKIISQVESLWYVDQVNGNDYQDLQLNNPHQAKLYSQHGHFHSGHSDNQWYWHWNLLKPNTDYKRTSMQEDILKQKYPQQVHNGLECLLKSIQIVWKMT